MASDDAVKAVFAELMGTWRDRFPAPTENDVVTWRRRFEGIDDQALGAAVTAICNEDGTWPPTPGAIRQRALGLRNYADPAHRPFELNAGPEAPRSQRVGDMLKRTRARLRYVVDLEKRPS